MFASFFRVAAFLSLLVAPLAQAQLAVTDPLANGIQIKTLLENVAQTTALTQQLEQLRQTVSSAQQTLDIARDVYAGIGEFQNFNADDFLGEGKAYFQSKVSEVGSLGQTLLGTGGDGSRFSANVIQRIDAYRDEHRRRETVAEFGTAVYDSHAALTLSREVEAAVSNPAMQKRLMASPAPATATEGLFQSDLSRVDPQLLGLYAYRRARSESSEEAALKVLAESMSPTTSVGKAQQLTAKSSAISATELARLNDTQTKTLTLQELERQERAQSEANTRRETDAVWGQLGQSVEKSFKRAPRDLALPQPGVK